MMMCGECMRELSNDEAYYERALESDVVGKLNTLLEVVVCVCLSVCLSVCHPLYENVQINSETHIVEIRLNFCNEHFPYISVSFTIHRKKGPRLTNPRKSYTQPGWIWTQPRAGMTCSYLED